MTSLLMRLRRRRLERRRKSRWMSRAEEERHRLQQNKQSHFCQYIQSFIRQSASLVEVMPVSPNSISPRVLMPIMTSVSR